VGVARCGVENPAARTKDKRQDLTPIMAPLGAQQIVDTAIAKTPPPMRQFDDACRQFLRLRIRPRRFSPTRPV